MSSLVEKTSRGEYHSKWDKIAKEEVEAADAEAEVEKAAAKVALGTDAHPASEHEAKDLETRAALKEAKALWEKRRGEETAQNLVVTQIGGERTVTREDLGDAKVVTVSECADCAVILGADLAGALVKVFVSHCANTEVRLGCSVVTSFVEMNRCESTTLRTTCVLHTIQCDLCEDCAVVWADGATFDAAKPEGPKVFSAACANLTVDAGDGRTVASSTADDVRDDTGVAADEQQFVTADVGGVLLTERCVTAGTSKRLVGATRRELDAEGASDATVAEEAALDADREKYAGNQAFGNREYGQAAVHYTLALERPHFGAGRPRAVLLTNRSACFLKLGQHDKALADAEAAVGIDATYCKAHFRRGLALHALGRFRDALPALGAARDLEPKNKSIADAIKFAEMRLARG